MRILGLQHEACLASVHRQETGPLPERWHQRVFQPHFAKMAAAAGDFR